LTAAAGIIVLLSVDGWQFWQRQATQHYLGQWCLFRLCLFGLRLFGLATYVDFPLLQLGLMGLWLRTPAAAP
jgi:hypothetical protein